MPRPADHTAPLPIDRASQTAVTATTPGLVKESTTFPPAIQGSAGADELLASGFSELYPVDPKAVVVAREEPAPQDIIAAQVFMNSGDRQAALSELIQNLQLTYFGTGRPVNAHPSKTRPLPPSICWQSLQWSVFIVLKKWLLPDSCQTQTVYPRCRHLIVR
jgi:hypothetical protein